MGYGLCTCMTFVKRAFTHDVEYLITITHLQYYKCIKNLPMTFSHSHILTKRIYFYSLGFSINPYQVAYVQMVTLGVKLCLVSDFLLYLCISPSHHFQANSPTLFQHCFAKWFALVTLLHICTTLHWHTCMTDPAFSTQLCFAFCWFMFRTLCRRGLPRYL